jgi:protease YdgD
MFVCDGWESLMRILAAVAVVAACVTTSVMIDAGGKTRPAYSWSEISAATPISLTNAPVGPRQNNPGKPPRAGGNDTCRWANDNECDEPGIGTGACSAGTDRSDCIRIIERREDDSCRWARDGECDEPNFGTGACVQGADRTDCGEIAWMRNQTDACATAYNGVCEEPGRGNGCEARTDRSDCHGRQRPMAINDHFFGNDDRVLVPVDEAPWRYMGLLRIGEGSCSATLVGRDVIVTAAHCISSENGINATARFISASGEHEANVIAYLVDANYNYRRFTTTDEIDGMDWALLRVDQPLGDTLGHANIRSITGPDQPLSTALMQAGYSWDTGGHLSGNLQCRMVAAHADNTFAHECDTTRGDSGSGFLVRNGNGFDLVGVDSNFRSQRGGPFIYIAVSAASFASQAPAFIAGRTGTRVGAGPAPRPPKTR